jgi:hypothetical protein
MLRIIWVMDKFKVRENINGMFVSLCFYNTMTFCYQNLGIVKIFCAIINSVHEKKRKMEGGQVFFYFFLFWGVGGGGFAKQKYP